MYALIVQTTEAQTTKMTSFIRLKYLEIYHNLNLERSQI